VNVPPRRRRRSHQATATVEFRDDVPDNAAAAADDRRDLARRRVSLKLDRSPGPAAGGDDDDEDEPGASGAMYAVAEGPEAVERPLSSGWAAALAAASAAGSVRAAAKRRTNVGRTNAFVPPPTRSTVPPPGPRAVARSIRRDSRPSRGLSSRNSDRHAVPPPPTRSLLCLSLTNPLRKLTISVVEWKYPFCRQIQPPMSLTNASSYRPINRPLSAFNSQTNGVPKTSGRCYES